jgi:hypothetical protein
LAPDPHATLSYFKVQRSRLSRRSFNAEAESGLPVRDVAVEGIFGNQECFQPCSRSLACERKRKTSKGVGAGKIRCATYIMIAEKCAMPLVTAIPDCFFALRLLF